MWEKTLSFFTSVINIGNLLVENQQTLKDLQKQTDETETALKLLAQKFEHFTALERANQRHFTEIIEVNQQRFFEAERASHRQNILELENRILQMERRLPPINEDKAE